MASSKVDDLSWSQLRQRRSLPRCVVESIPPEDMQSFLALIATNPLHPFPDAIAICSKLHHVREARHLSANLNSTSKHLSVSKTKRRRDLHSAIISDDDRPDSDTDDIDRPRRKNRRSTKPALSVESPEIVPPMSRSTPIPIGSEFQAVVPVKPLPNSAWLSHPPCIESFLVFSETKCGGHSRVNEFLRALNAQMELRTGFVLSPFAMEVALTQFLSCNADIRTAMQNSLKIVIPGPFFPGIKGPFGYEEQCLFVRSLAERSKNFSYISRHVLPNRSSSELVWLYYSRHKQLCLQNGGVKNGQVLDDGGERLKRVQLTTERTISALRNLAITAGDGFPMDTRALQAIAACRRGNLIRERKRRDDESIQKSSRLRSAQ